MFFLGLGIGLAYGFCLGIWWRSILDTYEVPNMEPKKPTFQYPPSSGETAQN